jgi:hypothetical protein
MFDSDLRRRECSSGGFRQGQEPQAFRNVTCIFPGLCGQLLNGIFGSFPFEQSAKALGLLERMNIGPK